VASPGIPDARPHFSFIAEHLYDLRCIGSSAGEDLFDLRDDYPPVPGTESQNREALLDKAFNEYLERTGTDAETTVPGTVDDARRMSSWPGTVAVSHQMRFIDRWRGPSCRAHYE
jgi:hypothetical protein